MFENIRADLRRKTTAYGVRPQDQSLFRKRIAPFLEFGTFAAIVYRFGRWAYKVKVPVIRQILITLYLFINVACMVMTGIHISCESDIEPGLVIHNFCGILVVAKKIGHSCTLNQGV
ncbi:MAG: serine acetyltransferase, partial [Verrucomicrobia bacterium]